MPQRLLVVVFVVVVLLLLQWCQRAAAFLPPAGRAPGPVAASRWGQQQGRSVVAVEASEDPGSEFVKRRPSLSGASGNATAAARRGAPGGRTPAMAPMKETMQLLFSADKREGAWVINCMSICVTCD